jgi:hypothetical protein
MVSSRQKHTKEFAVPSQELIERVKTHLIWVVHARSMDEGGFLADNGYRC